MRRFLIVLMALLALVPSGCPGKPKGAFRIIFIPKLSNIPYFLACKKGAEEAAEKLGIDLVYTGPKEANIKEQIDMVHQYIASGDCDCLCIACNDPALIVPALKEAKKQGILVVTYDADANDGRDFFVNQATYDAVAEAMVDTLAQEIGGAGKVGILTSSLTAPNQSEWARRIKDYVKRKYPKIVLLDEVTHGEDRELGVTKAKSLIDAEPELKGIIGLTSVAVPAAAEAVRQKGKKGQVKVTGVSTPKDMRDYVLDGTVSKFILWNPVDLGYLTVHVADRLRKKEMPENGTIEVDRLGKIQVRNREVLLGPPMAFTRETIDRYKDF
jgi:rhamnose transport system substrate-binding protein